MSFAINGRDLGIAYHDDEVPINVGFYPAISLEDKEAVIMNLGGQAFSYPPSLFSFKSVDSYLKSQLQESLSTEPKLESDSPVEVDLLDGTYDDIENIRKLNFATLRNELDKRNVKSGGTLDEKVTRLFVIRKLKDDDIPNNLRKQMKKK